MTPNRRPCQWTQPALGSVRVSCTRPRTGADTGTGAEPVQNSALLNRIAEVTGGRYWTANQVNGIAEHLRYSSSGVRTISHLPLWDMPLLFIFLLMLKISEWLLRRHWGQI